MKMLGATYINIRTRVFHASLKISLTLCMSNYTTLCHSKERNSQCVETVTT